MANGTVTETMNTPAILERANGLVVCDSDTYEAAAILKKELKAEYESWVEKFEPLRIRAEATYDEVLNEKRKTCEPYEKAITIVGNALNSYATKLAEERRAAQAKADAAARAAAEKERQVLLERAAAAKSGAKQEELFERAEMVFEKPVIVERKIAKTIKTEAGNVTQREGIEVIVVDIKLLCAEIGAGRVPITVVGERQRELAAWVKAMGVKACPGLIIRPKTIVV